MVLATSSANKQERDQANLQFEKMKLTEGTGTVLLEYITQLQAYPMANRQFVVIMLKNIIKKAYGAHSFTHYEEQKKKDAESIAGDESDPAFWIDQNNLKLLQTNLVNLVMGAQERPIQV